ncbi:MAG: prolipoprotein diacylglyceryl transferase [Pseudomonadales bacterium]|nr:prolipoprotein diacylglyceryl transferase [Pseudomonadales bacterium]
MQYPVIDPIILSLGGGLALRWYGLMYLLGFAAVWFLGNRRAKTHPGNWQAQEISDLVFFGAMGAVLGGRVGYVLFYNLDVFLSDPLYLFRMWEGGMSFHGGLLGVAVGVLLFARKFNREWLDVADFLTPLCPIGIGLGRMGNFINMELPGRVTDSALGFFYKCDKVHGLTQTCVGEWETVARHPSPLYQALTEGLLLFILVWIISAKPRPAGFVSGTFLMGYGAFRMMTENFRSPDSRIGFIAFDWLTMGQILSLPMLIAGILLIVWSRTQREANKPG